MPNRSAPCSTSCPIRTHLPIQSNSWTLPRKPAAAADGLKALPEVARVLSLGSFVPEDQAPTLAILEDTASLLGPTLSPQIVKPPPLPGEAKAAIVRTADDMARLGARETVRRPAWPLPCAKSSREVPRPFPRFPPISPPESAGAWTICARCSGPGPFRSTRCPRTFSGTGSRRTGAGGCRFSRGGTPRDNAVLRRFARAVQSVVPQAVGSAVTVKEWTRLAPRAFATAGLLALLTISVLLLAVLRSFRDIVLVLAPLLLAGLFTLGAAALLGFSINFANIITLPMMLGIGVAFDIYFVMRRRAGEPGLLGSSTARAVIFSALTTGTAFGSLALSRSPGMAEMGKFLSLALFFILVCTLFVLPVLFGENSARKTSGKGELG